MEVKMKGGAWVLSGRHPRVCASLVPHLDIVHVTCLGRLATRLASSRHRTAGLRSTSGSISSHPGLSHHQHSLHGLLSTPITGKHLATKWLPLKLYDLLALPTPSLALWFRCGQQWTRLIRFVAAETGQVHLGEPLDRWQDGASDNSVLSKCMAHSGIVGLAFHKGHTIRAYEIVGGTALDPAAQVSHTVLTVKHLLPPLSREQIGVVRCLGLNYADHAVSYFASDVFLLLTVRQAEAGMSKPQYV